MDKIRWGIIGCGDVTEKKSGPGFIKAEHSGLTAVMRRDGAKAKDYAERHGVPRWYSEADDLINDKEVDAVYIATPPAFHLQYTVQAAKAGKPVYVEKPMALNVSECLRMIETCRLHSVPLFVAYYRRALPRFLKIKQLLESGAIGTVRNIQTTLHTAPRPPDFSQEYHWRIDPSISGGGYLMDMGSHTLDFLDFLFGPIAEAHGFAANLAGLYPAEDTVSASFRFESGILGTGSWSFTVGEDQDSTEIIGTTGIIRFASFNESPVILQSAGKLTDFNIPYPPHVQQPLIQTVVNDLLGTGKCPSTGESALRTARVTEQLLSGYYAQKKSR